MPHHQRYEELFFIMNYILPTNTVECLILFHDVVKLMPTFLFLFKQVFPFSFLYIMLYIFYLFFVTTNILFCLQLDIEKLLNNLVLTKEVNCPSCIFFNYYLLTLNVAVVIVLTFSYFLMYQLNRTAPQDHPKSWIMPHVMHCENIIKNSNMKWKRMQNN